MASNTVKHLLSIGLYLDSAGVVNLHPAVGTCQVALGHLLPDFGIELHCLMFLSISSSDSVKCDPPGLRDKVVARS